MSIKKVAVIGAGTMGNGIAQVCATSGLKISLIDVSESSLEKGMSNIEKSLSKLVEKEKISSSQKDDALNNITTSGALKDCADADLVIEAATENLDLKLNIFKELDQVISDTCILASNTSSISLTKISSSTSCPDRVVGIHFMNPVPLMSLVEIIPGLKTSEKTTSYAIEFCKLLGKTSVVSKDSPAFIVNRILVPMINEAIFVLQEDIADVESIDTAMKLAAGYPMGPLTLADMIGLDVILFIMEVMHRDLGEDKYRPAPLLRRMVDAGSLGRKSGKGFYNYQ